MFLPIAEGWKPFSGTVSFLPPDGRIEYYVDGKLVTRDAEGVETYAEDSATRKGRELGQDPDRPPTAAERVSASVVACYFCGKRADGLTSNDLPSCANCRALPQRKR